MVPRGCIYARNMHQAGLFGSVLARVAYYHDGDLKQLVENKDRWQADGSEAGAGIAAAALSHAFARLPGRRDGERIRQLSALGWGNQHPYLTENVYKNPHFNECALMETDRHGSLQRVLAGWRGRRASPVVRREGYPVWPIMAHGDIRHERLGKAQPLTIPITSRTRWCRPRCVTANHSGSHVLSAEFINALVETTSRRSTSTRRWR